MSFTSENFDCPCCGAEVTAGAGFCRECGASDDSGWSREDEEGWAGEDDFDYDDYLEREFSITRLRPHRIRLWRAFTAAIIVLVCISIALLSVLGM